MPIFSGKHWPSVDFLKRENLRRYDTREGGGSNVLLYSPCVTGEKQIYLKCGEWLSLYSTVQSMLIKRNEAMREEEKKSK